MREPCRRPRGRQPNTENPPISGSLTNYYRRGNFKIPAAILRMPWLHSAFGPIRRVGLLSALPFMEHCRGSRPGLPDDRVNSRSSREQSRHSTLRRISRRRIPLLHHVGAPILDKRVLKDTDSERERGKKGGGERWGMDERGGKKWEREKGNKGEEEIPERRGSRGTHTVERGPEKEYRCGNW